MLLAATSQTSPMIALLAMVLGLVVLISLLLLRARQSLLVGYFLCGVLLANTGLSATLGTDPQAAISGLSELGIVLLMFTLGIEFSIRELIHLRRIVLGGGSAQMLLCLALAAGALSFCGLSTMSLLVVAFALALSSTAVSIKSFQDLGLPSSPGARFSLGVAIFQDLAVILFMVLLPSLLDARGPTFSPLLFALLKGTGFLGACWFLSRRAIPQLLHLVAQTRSRELFTITVIALCAFIAWGANWIGLSLALGAFAAGLVVSESIYSHRVLADILPFKDLFLTIFFVSVGLTLDLAIVWQNWPILLAGVLLLFTAKGLALFFIGRRLQLGVRQSLLSATALGSSGEFSLILLHQATDLGGLPSHLLQLLLAITALSMGLVPTLMRLAIPVGGWLESSIFKRHGSPENCLKFEREVETLHDHVIICGYGPVGQSLHEALERSGISNLIIEMNAETVRSLIHHKQHALFADATHSETMELARVAQARAIAFTFPDTDIALAGIHAAREVNPGIATFARAKFLNDVSSLRQAGVGHIFHDEATSGAALVDSVLGCYLSETPFPEDSPLPR